MKKVSNKSLLFTSLTAAALLLGACGTDEPARHGKKQQQVEAKEGSQGGDLVIAQLSDAVSLEPTRFKRYAIK